MAVVRCLLISEDFVFNETIHRLICYGTNGVYFTRINSFAKLKQLNKNLNPDIIIMDDSISGTGHSEVITFLKDKLEFTAPMYFFSGVDYIEKLVVEYGVSYFFKKPFEPKEVTREIILKINSVLS